MMVRFKRWISAHREAGLLVYWIPFLIVFRSLEYILLPQNPIASSLDPLIPFCVWFAIPYFSWFFALALAQGYYLFSDRRQFENLCFLMFSGMTIALITYLVYPISINVRVPLSQQGILYDMVRSLQAMDSPRNVCPSIHVSTSVAIAVVVCCDGRQRTWIKGIVGVWMLLISASTVFIKQHSVIDVFWAVVMTAGLAWMTYRWNWRGLFRKTSIGRLFV